MTATITVMYQHTGVLSAVMKNTSSLTRKLIDSAKENPHSILAINDGTGLYVRIIGE